MTACFAPLALFLGPPLVLYLTRRYVPGSAVSVLLVAYLLALLPFVASVAAAVLYRPPDGTIDVPYGTEITAAASAHGVDPRLLAALVKVESNYNPRAVSNAGAQGLGQLMPIIQRACNLEDPFDPAANLDCSAWFLGTLLRKYPTRDLAIAAYHAGEPKVDACNCVPRPVDRQYVNMVEQAMLALPVRMAHLSAGSEGITYPYASTPRITGLAMHGLSGWEGVDVKQGCGSEVVAPITGKVTYNGLDGYVGPHSNGEQNTMLTIAGRDGRTTTTLLHGRYTVSVGDEVIAGRTMVGTEASIGNSTGCHTHWIVKVDGSPVDPLRAMQKEVE